MPPLLRAQLLSQSNERSAEWQEHGALYGIDLEALDADRLFHLMYTCRYLLYRQ